MDSRKSRERDFETMVRAHYGELYRFAHWQCRDAFVAEEVVQETFIRAWKGWDSLRDPRALKSWLYTILVNENYRAHRRKHPDMADVDLDSLIADESSVENALEMRDALKELPESYREPLLLQVLGGFSCQEIADIIGTTEGATMTRLTRARLAMRRLLSGQGERHSGEKAS